MKTFQLFAFLLLACFGVVCRWISLISSWPQNNAILHSHEEVSIHRETPIPIPLQILLQYQRWHSEESLQRDQRDRKYAVAFYACPLQAGNRIHHFLTGAWVHQCQPCFDAVHSVNPQNPLVLANHRHAVVHAHQQDLALEVLRRRIVLSVQFLLQPVGLSHRQRCRRLRSDSHQSQVDSVVRRVAGATELARTS